jgi:hypothetical protein
MFDLLAFALGFCGILFAWALHGDWDFRGLMLVAWFQEWFQRKFYGTPVLLYAME